MYVCMHECMHVCLHVCLHVCIRMNISIHIDSWYIYIISNLVCAYSNLSFYLSVCLPICLHACVYIWMATVTYVYIHILRCQHVYINI